MKKASKKEMDSEMMCKHCIVKRKGHTEEFDERKIYATCRSACLSSGMKLTECEKVCDKVCKDIRMWAHKKVMITSEEIFKKTTAEIKKHSSKAAFMYETHRDVA